MYEYSVQVPGIYMYIYIQHVHVCQCVGVDITLDEWVFIVYSVTPQQIFCPQIHNTCICPLLIAAKLYTLVRQLEEKKKQGSHRELNPGPPALAAGALNPDTQICPVIS